MHSQLGSMLIVLGNRQREILHHAFRSYCGLVRFNSCDDYVFTIRKTNSEYLRLLEMRKLSQT